MTPDSFAAASDEELIDHYGRSGQRQALATLLDRYLVRLRGLVFSMTASPGDVDDLTQEVFLRVIRGLPQFQRRAKFSTWLYRVAMNTVYQSLRQRERSRPGDVAAMSAQAGPRADQPDQRAADGEMNRRIAAAVGALSPSLRAAVALMAIEGLSGEEAAAIEGCTASTMYWRLHEARRQLARRLGEYLPPRADTTNTPCRRESSRRARGMP